MVEQLFPPFVSAPRNFHCAGELQTFTFLYVHSIVLRRNCSFEVSSTLELLAGALKKTITIEKFQIQTVFIIMKQITLKSSHFILYFQSSAYSIPILIMSSTASQTKILYSYQYHRTWQSYQYYTYRYISQQRKHKKLLPVYTMPGLTRVK